MSCSCKKKVTQSSVAVEPTTNIKISSTLPEQTWETVIRTEIIEMFEIRKIRIEGTPDEYSNKLIFVRELEVEERQAFLAHLINDTSYDWADRDRSSSFSPGKQYVLRSQQGSVNVLADTENSLISFINLEGQRVLAITASLHAFIDKL